MVDFLPKVKIEVVVKDGDVERCIEAIVKELLAAGFAGPTTLEIAGEEAVKISAERLRQWAR